MGVRADRRTETTTLILEVAREHLAREGAAALSLRAVARDVGLAVSALYRYFPSRDDLLTALITEAYDDCASAVEDSMRRARHSRRTAWTAAGHAYRTWAWANPSRFLLIFGTPVPGYVAPVEPTVTAGTRIPRLLAELLVGLDVPRVRMPAVTRRGLRGLAEALGADVSPDALAAGITAWDSVHGHVMSELSGQLGPLNGDPGLFDVVVREQASRLGL
jgi:AcrR family transcriptional regulator